MNQTQSKMTPEEIKQSDAEWRERVNAMYYSMGYTQAVTDAANLVPRGITLTSEQCYDIRIAILELGLTPVK